MKFSDFAKILFSIIGGRKYPFTIDLLKAGLDADGVEFIKSLRNDESGKSRIRKYLSGDNDITEIAPNILTNFRQDLFVDYIIESIDESNYPELCKRFEDAPFNLTIEIDDVPQRLTEIYEEILINAAKGNSSNTTSQFNLGNSKLITKIDSTIIELIEIGRKIAEFKKTGAADDIYYAKLKNSLHSHFKQLTTLSNSLSKSVVTVDPNTVEKITDSVMRLEENSFILTTDEFIVESIKNHHIHRLIRLLSQLQDN